MDPAAWIALAMFVGLPLAVLLLVAAARRRTRRAPADLEQRLAEVEQVVVIQDARITALEQDRAPLYRVQ